MSLSASQLPGSLHELNEVLVVVHGGRHGGVVVVPLASLNAAVAVLVSEVGQEIEENFVLGHLAGNDLRVQVAGVDSLEVSSVDGATAVVVELEEGLVNEGLALSVRASLFKLLAAKFKFVKFYLLSNRPGIRRS